jgi:hypothetical protein
MSSNKLTTEIFIERSLNIHNNKYDYSKVNYTGINLKLLLFAQFMVNSNK